MSDDRNTMNPSPKRGENDKEYYEDLYNDLPKEVVDILMKTHPLMSKEEGDTVASRSKKRPSREDVAEVREARMQQVGTEINEIRQAPQQEGEPTKYVSRRARNNEQGFMEEGQSPAPVSKQVAEDDYEDGIQYVSVMPSRKKSKMMEGNTMQPAPTKKKKARRDEELFEDFSTSARPRYEEMDFEEKAKQEHLDSLYDDYDDDDYHGGSKLTIVLGVVALIIIAGLIFKCVSLSSQLEEAQNQATVNQELTGKYEKIQLEKMQLEEELAKLQNPEGAAAGGTDGVTTGTTGTTGGTTTGAGGATTGTGTTGATNTAGFTEYVVVDGDTGWSIAQKVYGNGAEFQKILDANGLKETDTMKIGTKLKIPKK